MSKGKRKKNKTKRFWRFFRIQMFLILVVVAGIGYYYAGGYAAKVSEMKNAAEYLVVHSTEDTFRQAQTSIVYDHNGEVISVMKGEKDVYYLESRQIPDVVKNAIISIEDKKFYIHHGVDYQAIARAALAMVKNNGEITQGGSTITQQLVKNMFLTQDKTWERKVEEIYIAVELEEKYTKEQILEFYLNNIYFGNGYYGIQAASKGYFNLDVTDLSLSQVCFLCAIPNNPTTYDPVNNVENTYARRDLILENMFNDGRISEKAYNEALAERITLNRPKSIKNDYVETYTYACATKILMENSGFEFKDEFKTDAQREVYEIAYQEAYNYWNTALYTGGYRIYTSIDLTMQQQLQDAIDTNLEEFDELNDEGIYALQSASVCIDNSNGMVKAIVGGRSQEHYGYTLNRAFQSFRQPGSAIKPLIVYTPSLERGYMPNTIVVDEPFEDGPKNSGGYSGEITVRTAVAYSKNTIAWKLFEELTPKVGISYLTAMDFGKVDSSDEVPAAALGGFTTGVSPLDMAKGYATLVNDGYYRDPGCIEKITDTEGNVIYEVVQTEVSIYKENASRLMTDMLKDVVTVGTAKGLTVGDQICAGKTGTTNSNRDGWFVGYTAYYTTSVWVGYDMPREVPGLRGSSYPASIWQDYMTVIHEGLPPAEFVAPTNYLEEEDELVPEDGIIDEEQAAAMGQQQYVPYYPPQEQFIEEYEVIDIIE